MIYSKSFGYAVRGVLYVLHRQNEKRWVPADEVAESLAVPRHFMSKILKRLAKAGVLVSSKGKAGGFTTDEATEKTALMDIFILTDGGDHFSRCSLRLQACRADNPCPLHSQMEVVKRQLKSLLSGTTIGDLLKGDKAEFIRQLTTAY